MRASPSHSSVPQCCKSLRRFVPRHPPQSHSRSRLRVHANGSTGGRSSPHLDEIFHFAGNGLPRGQQPWEVLSLPVDPLGEVCPKSHPRQRLPPSGAAPLREWLLPALRGSLRLSKLFPYQVRGKRFWAVGAPANSVAPFTGSV